MLPLLDAGIAGSQPYAVIDQPPDSTDLGTLLKEVGGAMPAFLAAEYGWSIASVLRAIHERGGWHGEVRPGLLLVGPVTLKAGPDGALKRRPAPNATVKLAETGLIPKRPPIVPAAPMVGPEEVPDPVSAPIPPADVLAYLPPERLDRATYEPTGDIYGLGASLYLLLAGRAPFAADTPEALLNKVRTSEPVALTTLRPDVPADLAALVTKLLAKNPDDRPHTAAEVCDALAGFCRPGSLPTAPLVVKGGNPNAVAVAVPHAASDAPVAEAAPAESVEEFGWGVNPHAFTDPHPSSSEPAKPRKRREMTEGEKRKAKIWMLVGLCLHLTGVALLLAWLGGVFDSAPSTPTPDPEPKKSTPQKPPRGEKNKNKGDG
jgi:serine/threonine protein kinase